MMGYNGCIFVMINFVNKVGTMFITFFGRLQQNMSSMRLNENVSFTSRWRYIYIILLDIPNNMCYDAVDGPWS
jgi:hypothetical protein